MRTRSTDIQTALKRKLSNPEEILTVKKQKPMQKIMLEEKDMAKSFDKLKKSEPDASFPPERIPVPALSHLMRVNSNSLLYNISQPDTEANTPVASRTNSQIKNEETSLKDISHEDTNTSLKPH